MKCYRTKITDYNYKRKVSIYQNEIVYDTTNEETKRQKYDEMSDKKKELSDKRRIRYYKKAVAELIEIALMNKDLNVVITLTFKDPITSYDSALAKWQLFLKRLRHSIKIPLKYICVWEYQRERSYKLGIENGGVFHFHCLMNIGYIEHTKLEKIWNNGYVWIDKITEYNRNKSIKYTTKYCLKEIVSRINNNEDIRGQRFFFTSNNLSKPTTIRLEESLQLEDVIIEHLENMITDSSYDILDESNYVINHVDTIEYYTKGK